MHDSAEHRRAVLRRARRALEEGAELPGDLPETIRYSWTRSRLAAAPMDRISVPYLAADVAGERLLNAARPVLDRFAQQLAGTRVSLVLADPDGRVAGRWAADSSALRTLARVSIEEGYVLAEDLAGTNGIGTALEELAPVTIFGAEHYAEPLQHLVCAGVPIRHPLTRRIEGVLDLACPTGDANGLLMPATLDLCAQIERELSMRAPERERVVFDAFVARSRVTNAALIALSEQYMVTNAAAADLLDPSDETCLWQQAVESLALGRSVTRPLQLSSGSTIMARCTPIMTGARPVGALIEAAVTSSSDTMSGRRRPARLSRGEQARSRAAGADDVRPDDLMYVRRVLERESAALASGRLSPDIHARMTGLCAQMRAPLPAQHIAAADHEFHMILLQCSGNAALRLLGATLSQSLHRSMLGMREFIASDRRAQLDMARAHDRVLEAVVGGDSQRAWKEMDHHFTLNERIARRIQRRNAAVQDTHARGE